MKTNTILQLVLMAVIATIVAFIVRASQQTDSGPDIWGPDPAPDKATSGTPVAPTARPGMSFPSLGNSVAFATIQKTPTPTPTPRRRTPTPRPTPDIDKVLAVEGWRLSSVWKGQAEIELTRKKQFITLKLNESRKINYARQDCDVKVTGMNDSEQSMTIEFSGQTRTLKAF